MDEGFEEQLDINDTCDSVECSLSSSDWPRYFQERTSRQVAYFEKKNNFIFNVRLAFSNIHAFDLGVISYDKYEYLMISKVENMRKYATDFQYPFMAFEFIVYSVGKNGTRTSSLFTMICTSWCFLRPQSRSKMQTSFRFKY